MKMHTPEQEPRTTDADLKSLGLVIVWVLGAIFGLVIFSILLANAMPTVKLLAPYLIAVLLVSLVLTYPALLIARLWKGQKEEKRKDFLTCKFAANENGIIPAVYDPVDKKFVQALNGATKPVVPQTLTLHQSGLEAGQVARLFDIVMKTRTTVEEEPQDLQVPGPCDFTQVLQSGFRPSPEAIMLAYPAGGAMITSASDDLCHVANAGATGGGKTSNIRLVTGQLLSAGVGAEVMLLNPHHTSYDVKHDEDWTPIEDRLRRPPMIAYEDIGRWMFWAADTELVRRLGCWKRSEYWGRPLFMVIDELPAITQHLPEFAGWMSDILREGRKVEMFLIVAATDFLVKTLNLESGAIRDCFRTAFYVGGDETTARKLLDLRGAIDDGTFGKGLGMLRSSEVKRAVRVRIPYMSNAALYQMLGPSRLSHDHIALLKRAYREGRVVESSRASDVGAPLVGEPSEDAYSPRQDGPEMPTWRANGHLSLTRQTGSLRPLCAPTHPTSDAREEYPRMSREQEVQFMALYRVKPNIDFCLKQVNCSTRHRPHARALIKQYGEDGDVWQQS